VLCSLRGISFRFDGTITLKVKETDRIQALKNELAKFGIDLKSSSDGNWIEFDGTTAVPKDLVHEQKGSMHVPETREHGPEVNVRRARGTIKIKTYQDHRMAMAFAPAAILGYKIDIENPGVVSKSYPCYWDDIKKAGFRIRQKGSPFHAKEIPD
jgi:3-phosphoshikimate 1-carboxyvinyltransferase